MRTNRNFFSKLSKATFTIALVFTSLATVSCQNNARQSFEYKTDFIRQMVYQISNEFFTRAGELSTLTQNNLNEAAKVLVNSSGSDTHANFTSAANENELADFLTRAAQFNAPVSATEVEKDNTLDFLIQAAQLNVSVADMEDEQDNILDFLTAAAQFNTPVAQDNDSSDDTLDFLINAAQMNAQVAAEESSQDSNLLDFLSQAGHLNNCVAE